MQQELCWLSLLINVWYTFISQKINTHSTHTTVQMLSPKIMYVNLNTYLDYLEISFYCHPSNSLALAKVRLTLTRSCLYSITSLYLCACVCILYAVRRSCDTPKMYHSPVSTNSSSLPPLKKNIYIYFVCIHILCKSWYACRYNVLCMWTVIGLYFLTYTLYAMSIKLLFAVLRTYSTRGTIKPACITWLYVTWISSIHSK